MPGAVVAPRAQFLLWSQLWGRNVEYWMALRQQMLCASCALKANRVQVLPVVLIDLGQVAGSWLLLRRAQKNQASAHDVRLPFTSLLDEAFVLATLLDAGAF